MTRSLLRIYTMVGTVLSIIYIPIANAGQAQAMKVPFGIYAYDPESWNGDVAARFPIVVVQYRSWQANALDIQHIKDLVASGSRVIIDFEFWSTLRQRQGKDNPALEDVIEHAETLLNQLKGVPIEAISLDEENKPTPQRLAMLNNLYLKIKKNTQTSVSCSGLPLR